MWLGVLRLSARQLQQRWLESALIVVGIALGVGVLTTGQALVRFQTVGLVELVAQEVPEWRAVSVRPVRIELSSQFFGQESLPAVPVSAEVLTEPVQPTLEDVLAVREEVPGVALATVEYGARSASVVAVEDGPPPGPGQPALQLQTVTPDEFAFRGLRFVAGGPFTWDDLLAGRAVLVLDESGARRLFPDLTPAEVIGRTVTEASGSTGARWQIVGVVEPGGGLLAQLMQAQGIDMVLGYVPAASRPWLAAEGGAGAPDPRSTTFNTAYFTPESEALIPQVVAGVEAYFSQKYGAGNLDVRNPQAQREEALAWLRPAVLGILVLAGLGLLIAAINILNLFTARVLRRKRIIGASMALGATRGMLFWQTAGEALLLGLLGSLGGLVIASGLIQVLRAVLIQLEGGSGVVAEIYALFRLGFDDGLLGLAVGILVSLVFGIYPALLGARQDPVEALRVE